MKVIFVLAVLVLSSYTSPYIISEIRQQDNFNLTHSDSTITNAQYAVVNLNKHSIGEHQIKIGRLEIDVLKTSTDSFELKEVTTSCDTCNYWIDFELANKKFSYMMQEKQEMRFIRVEDINY